MTKTLFKLIFLLYSSITIMLSANIYTLIFVSLVLFFILFVKRIDLPYKYFLILMLPLYFIFGTAYVLEYGFYLQVLLDSLKNTSVTVLKLMIIIMLNTLVIKQISFIELNDAFKRLNLSEKFAFSVMILTTILPLIFKTANQIYQAQLLRGLNKRDFLTQKGWILFLSPLFIHVFSYSQQISLNFELKDYSKVGILEENTMKLKDYLFFLFLFILFFGIYSSNNLNF